MLQYVETATTVILRGQCFTPVETTGLALNSWSEKIPVPPDWPDPTKRFRPATVYFFWIRLMAGFVILVLLVERRMLTKCPWSRRPLLIFVYLCI